MSDDNALTPYQAAIAANNVYYTLSGWSANRANGGATAPTRGMEQWDVVDREVTGSGSSSLAQGGLDTELRRTCEGRTIGATTGFGYVTSFNKGGAKHVVVATRGTRPEIGSPDLLTDFYATPTGVAVGHRIHRGFAKTFQSLKGNLDQSVAIKNADVVHCVGHSLGGAIANINAMYIKAQSQNKDVRLYTFGAPRVGLHFGFATSLESMLGKDKIYRVSHTDDPITWIPTFPYLHVLGSTGDDNNILLRSPAGPGSMTNHSMDIYAKEMEPLSWSAARALKHLSNFEDRLMKDLWMSQSEGVLGGIAKGSALIGGGVVWILMKVLRGILKLLAGSIILLVATPMDLICRMLAEGVNLAGKLGSLIWRWVKSAANAIGHAVNSAKDVTTTFLRYLLDRLMSVVRVAAERALQNTNNMMQYGPLAPVIWGAMGAGAGFYI